MHHTPRIIALFALTLLLAAACGPAPAAPTATATLPPTMTPTPLAIISLQPTATIGVPATANPTVVRTALPTVTPTTDDPAQAARPTALPSQPAVEEGVAPPYDITLPDRWKVGYGVLPVRDGITQEGVPVAIYTGPIPGYADVTGWLVVLWGFPSLSSDGLPDPWADGLRFLRGSLLDTSCNIGTDLARNFDVGGREDAVGTFFSAVSCRGEEDTAGWFAGLNEQGGNYVFFTYVEPLQGIDNARATLQGILDSVAWHIVPTRAP